MRLVHERETAKRKDVSFFRRCGRKIAAKAVVAATLFTLGPMAERVSHAEEGQPAPVEAAPAAPAEGQPVEAPPAASEPAPAVPPVSAPTEAPAEEEPEAAARSPGLEYGEGAPSPYALQQSDAEEPDYRDLSLSMRPTDVDISGRPRHFTLDNAWDMGANLYNNEAGSSIWGSITYTYRRNRHRVLDLRLDAGNIWFGEQAAPFGRLYFRPELNLRQFRGIYYGSVAAMGYMPSYLYTSHSVGLGYSQPIGDSMRLRAGFIIGGALSYPAWDDIYLNMAGGLSFEMSNWLVYGMVNSYFAAPNPMATAYFGHYRPQFQNAEFGIQARFYEDQYTARAFGDVGVLYERFGVRITRTINFSESVEGDVFIAGGATHWTRELGGRWDPVVMLGLNIVIGGDYINSTNTVLYEHLQAGGVRFAETDFPSQERPGPYGFGRSGDPEIDGQVNTAKERILTYSSFQDFAGAYAGASTSEVIMAARFLGAFLQQVAYANDAYDALNNTDFLNSEVERISNASTESMYGYIRRYVEFYNGHRPGEQLPDDLRSGIAICAGIHHVMAEFLRANGIPTIVASVNTPNGPHVVAIAQHPDGTVLLDYGNSYETPPDTFDQAMRFYGQNRRAPTFQSQLFGPDGYIGTYETPEGRLLHRSIGIHNMDALARDFLGVR